MIESKEIYSKRYIINYKDLAEKLNIKEGIIAVSRLRFRKIAIDVEVENESK
jgi:hypothetical protein